MTKDYTLATVERAAIIRALEVTEGVKERAYKLLKIGRSTLYRKIREYKINVSEYQKTPEESSSGATTVVGPSSADDPTTVGPVPQP